MAPTPAWTRAALVVAVTFVVSGCFVPPDNGTAPDDSDIVPPPDPPEVAASQLIDAANASARDWAVDAMINGMSCFEGALFGQFKEAHDEDPELPNHWVTAGDDTFVGDGRCRVWSFTYVSEAKAGHTFTVQLDHEGNELGTQEQEVATQPRTIASWSVDSDAALSTARATSPGLRTMLVQDDAALFVYLAHPADNENPFWFVLPDDDSNDPLVVTVDAVTGQGYSTDTA